jgi:hypothetical protein
MKRQHHHVDGFAPTATAGLSGGGLGRFSAGSLAHDAAGMLSLLALAVACQTEPDRDLGATLEERGLPVSAENPPGEPFVGPIADFVGRWVGSAEDPLALGGARATYVFPSGSSAITLNVFAPETEGGSPYGSIVFGAGTAPPAPTDPDAGYPTNVDYVALSYFDRAPFGPTDYVGPLPPHEGFEYELLPAIYGNERSSAGLADGLLRMSYDTHQLLDPWCALHLPVQQPDGTYSCVAALSSTIESDGSCSIETGNDLDELIAALSDEELIALDAEDWAELERQTVRELEPIDCNKLFLCATARCECDESSCHADRSDFTAITSVRPTSYSYAELTLRATPEGDGLIGIFTNAVFSNERQMSVPVGGVHFERAE